MITFDKVTKDFKTDFWEKPFRALDEISFELKPGNIVGFLGANGAGKTTAIKILLEFIKPSSGSVVYHETLGKEHKEIYKNIGYLPERPYFYPDLTGRELLNYVGQINSMSGHLIKSESKKWSEFLKIDFALDRKLRFYSKGMLQRIGFVSALIKDPKLLILDEPLAGLDPMGRKEFKDVMNLLVKEGKTIFFSSHILNDVEEVSEEVVILKSGKVIYSGSSLELIKTKSNNVFDLLIEGGEPSLLNRFNSVDQGIFKKISIEESELSSTLKELIGNEIRIESIRRQTPSLEDIIYRIGI
ncbi:MAG: ABC-2 type transport system ATP-binding protein [Bacteriovoracaceae bacterium]